MSVASGGARLVGALFALCVATGCGGESAHTHASLPSAAEAPVLGTPDDAWTVTSVDGEQTTRLADLAGEVVFVNLWATWCGPCVKELPSIQALADAFADEPVRFLVVSDEDAETVRRFAEDKDFRLPFARSTTALPEAFDSGGLIPATFILDRQGRVRHRHVGFRDWDSPELHDFLRDLLDAES